jgi:hypothetical protein
VCRPTGFDGWPAQSFFVPGSICATETADCGAIEADRSAWGH